MLRLTCQQIFVPCRGKLKPAELATCPCAGIERRRRAEALSRSQALNRMIDFRSGDCRCC